MQKELNFILKYTFEKNLRKHSAAVFAFPGESFVI